MGVLSSLWEALEVEQEDVDRGIFARLMSGPARLHGKSIQKVLRSSLCQLSLAVAANERKLCCGHITLGMNDSIVPDAQSTVELFSIALHSS